MVTAENQPALDVPQLVREARERTKDYLSPTPLEFSRYLSDQIDGEVWLKLDLVQKTASFKYRGAVNKVLSLTEEELDAGVVTASTGNYALAVAEEEGKTYVSPYNDPIVVGGQGTCGLEISEQLPDVDAALFAGGAGGLLTGSSGWLKSHNPKIETYGVSPANSPVMYESVRQNKMITMDTETTLADTCAGGVDLDSITLDLCQRYVDEMMLLTEDEIAASIRLLFEQHRLVSEGSGALGVGGLLKRKQQLKGKKVVAVVCGRNIDLEVFKRIVA